MALNTSRWTQQISLRCTRNRLLDIVNLRSLELWRKDIVEIPDHERIRKEMN
ncbi:hypothetical protein CHS0354_030576 [Potamilus streckersoni]|uniref:Uncharacterized protein n=1 Tax=Potamilus streckersoni TaxID=2493646 RepID=A0AAE0VUH9_9BIVA|nr:hypothetical protein CHS0354_030576 [Potamilus streckersoni]